MGSLNHTSARWSQAVSRFGRDRQGNIAIIFALTMTPILFAVGAAIDYSSASDLRAKLQRATDATNLQLCQTASTTTQAQLTTSATAAMTGYMGTQAYEIATLTQVANPRQITFKTTAIYNTIITKTFGTAFATIPVAADAQCLNPQTQQTFEIALVLDNTGSMNESSGSVSKMDALKSAATNFVNYIYATPKLAQAKISIVPFAAAVAVPTSYRTASWIDQNGKSVFHWDFLKGGAAEANTYASSGVKSRFDVFTQLKTAIPAWDWTGCLESLAYPYNVRDGSPVTYDANSYYVPMFAPDESGPGGSVSHTDPTNNNTVYSVNSYIDDVNSQPGCSSTNATKEDDLTGRSCKYIEIKTPKTSNGYLATGPNAFCTTRPLTRITNNKTLLLNEISAMQPNGSTNIHEGMMWGWRTISPLSVFADGVAYSTANNNKIVILMTDGNNTWYSNSANPTLKSYYSAYGYYNNSDTTTTGAKNPNLRVPAANANISTDDQARAAIDALTQQACTNAKASPANVQIYTIGFSVPSDPIDKQGLSLLQNCASSPSQAFAPNDSASLTDAFQKIADSIGNLRLTQ